MDWSKSSPVAGKPNAPLQRETVACAALQLLDEVGLDGLTMRRLAARLDIQNPSLYWHFTNKQELINCMAELMISDEFAELHALEPDQDWDDWLSEYAHLFRRLMLGHRDGARTLAEADVSLSNFFVGVELALDVLQEAGFEALHAAAGVITIIHFALGTTYEAQADPTSLRASENDTRLSTKMASLDAERFPRIAALLHTTEAVTPPAADVQFEDVLFEEGLSLILEGMRATLAKKRRHGGSRTTI